MINSSQPPVTTSTPRSCLCPVTWLWRCGRTSIMKFTRKHVRPQLSLWVPISIVSLTITLWTSCSESGNRLKILAHPWLYKLYPKAVIFHKRIKWIIDKWLQTLLHATHNIHDDGWRDRSSLCAFHFWQQNINQMSVDYLSQFLTNNVFHAFWEVKKEKTRNRTSGVEGRRKQRNQNVSHWSCDFPLS